MAEFVVFFSMLREHVIYVSGAPVNNSIILVDKDTIFLTCVLSEGLGWLLVIILPTQLLVHNRC